ncbi:hypothetical protein [Dyadobacter psychrotolerans]|uniref:Toxin-antitoxin system YwqK family antitoxin n=1 Tax=Dyadobacter psychrotolerans TaxID=2541721 RepID=A0A4R5DKJ0_9BACT|nr:hypothetical protein [Dyadobacter psychrotolerans]TDE14696.1 hypothetical protein E0F88_16040 [Dyadobacter psychrotolerans]
MKKNLYLLFFLPLWLACKPVDAPLFGVEPKLAYNDEALFSKKTYCTDAACNDPFQEELYLYNASGKLTRINYYSRTAIGKLENLNYTDLIYNASGQLTNKISYHKIYQGTGFEIGSESEFEYKNGVLHSEKMFSNFKYPDRRVATGEITYLFENGKKTSQSSYDMQNKLSYRIGYTYKNDVLTRETYYDPTGKEMRSFEHLFSGNLRQIGEYVASSKEQVALIERRYDDQGRLLTQQTKVSNPLLCAMVPGMIRYSY